MPFFLDEHNSPICLLILVYIWDDRKATNSPSLTKSGQKWPLRYDLGFS